MSEQPDLLSWSPPPPVVSAPTPALAKPKRARGPRQVALVLAARPIVKSAGGKGRLLPILRAHLPATFGGYLEPFCGGAALYFDLGPRLAAVNARAVLGDLNADLIETYSALAFDVETVIRNLHEHAERHAQDAAGHYYYMRELWNDPTCEMGTCERAAVYLYLHRVCFNGLHRVNQAGEFNVPIGRYKNPEICHPGKLRAAAAMFARAKLCAGDFQTITPTAAAGDLVYMDPVYDVAPGAKSFTAYTTAGGGPELQERIAWDAMMLADRGVRVLVSNADTALVRELYPVSRWRVTEIMAPRSVAASGGKRGKVPELLISSYAPQERSPS